MIEAKGIYTVRPPCPLKCTSPKHRLLCILNGGPNNWVLLPLATSHAHHRVTALPVPRITSTPPSGVLK